MPQRWTSSEQPCANDAQVNLRRRRVTALLLSTALAAPLVPTRARPHTPPFEVIDFDWVDRSRARSVPARLYWPRAEGFAVSVPLVVFSHGIGGSKQGYSYLGKHWSARGVASLHIQHVGSDTTLWSGNPLGIVSRLQNAAQESEAVERAADVRFALDRILESGNLGAAINRQRLIAAGHSYGANTTLLTIGARVMRNGRFIDCLDSRFCAAVVISAPPFYGESDLRAVLGKVSTPSLHVTSTDDVIEIPGYYSAAADRLAIFDAIDHPRKMLAVFRGGSHSMFTNRRFTGGPSLNAKVKVATADLALAFFDLVFDGDGRALTHWRSQWQSIVARASTFASTS